MAVYIKKRDFLATNYIRVILHLKNALCLLLWCCTIISILRANSVSRLVLPARSMESNICVQAEFSAADNARDHFGAHHKDAISIIKEEMGYKNEEDIANLIASQRQELLSLRELLKAKDEEKFVLASKFKEDLLEFSALKRKYEDLVLANEAHSQVQKSLEERMDAKQNELIALKAVTEKEARRIEQIMSEKLQEMEHSFQLKITENECLLQAQKCLQVMMQ